MLWRSSPRRRSPPKGFVIPCQPTLVAHPPTGADWLHEVKHDGFGILARKQGERVKIWSRRGADFTDRFSRIAESVRGLPADEALIDGEAVVFQDDGRSDFHALLTKRGWLIAVFLAFDLLRLNGDDLRQRLLEKRRQALARAHRQEARRRNRVQRGACRRGRGGFQECLCVWPRRHRVEAGGKLLQERKKPQLAEDEEPGFRQDVTHGARTVAG